MDHIMLRFGSGDESGKPACHDPRAKAAKTRRAGLRSTVSDDVE